MEEVAKGLRWRPFRSRTSSMSNANGNAGERARNILANCSFNK
jgi:hypothetical protein